MLEMNVIADGEWDSDALSFSSKRASDMSECFAIFIITSKCRCFQWARGVFPYLMRLLRHLHKDSCFTANQRSIDHWFVLFLLFDVCSVIYRRIDAALIAKIKIFVEAYRSVLRIVRPISWNSRPCPWEKPLRGTENYANINKLHFKCWCCRVSEAKYLPPDFFLI